MSAVPKCTFAEELDARWRDILRIHPALRNPAEPVKLGCVNGTFRLDAAEFWAEYSQREWTPRPSPQGNLVGPFRMYGECLDPVCRPEEMHWYDTALPAQAGDIVLVRWEPSVLEDMYARNAGDAAWMQQYGAPCPIATKVLVRLGSEYYLATRKSIIPLGKNQVLGVLGKVVRGGALPRASAVHAIEPNAATDTAMVSYAGPVNVTLTAPSTQVANFQVLYTGLAVPVDCEIEVSAAWRWGISGTVFETQAFLYRATAGGTIQDGNIAIYKDSNLYEHAASMALFSASAGTYRFGLACTIQLGDGVNNSTAIFRDINIRVAVIKR